MKRLRDLSIRDKIGNAQRRRSILEEQVGNLKRLLEQGYIERSRLLASQNELVKVEETIADLRSSFVRLEVEDRQRAEYWTDRVNRAEKEVEAIHDEVLNPGEITGRARDKSLEGALAQVENRLTYGMIGDVFDLAAAYAAADVVAAADWLAQTRQAPALRVGHSFGGGAVRAAAPEDVDEPEDWQRWCACRD